MNNGRWFRFYDEALNDPKVQRLSGDLFKAWINLLCVASKTNGQIASAAEAAFGLRLSEDKARTIVAQLAGHGLLDAVTEGYFEPHGWALRQYKSDVTDPTAPNRMRNYRNRKRNATVTVTPTRTDTETEQKGSELRSALPDARTRLFSTGAQMLSDQTGRTPDSCKSLIGRWLKLTDDEAVHVLAAIEDAHRNRVADPTAWITATLKSRGNPHAGTRRSGAKPDGIKATFDRIFEGLDGRDEAGALPRQANPRLLSNG